MGIPLSATLTSPFSRGTEYSSALSGISSVRGDNLVANAIIITLTACTRDIQKTYATRTGKGRQGRLQAQADSEERAIPPDGFLE